MNSRILALALSLAALLGGVQAQEGSGGDDLEVIRGRVLADLLAQDAGAAAGFLEKIDGGGRFSDLDYAEVSPAHLSRVEILCVAYRRPEHALHGKGELREGILLALDRWLADDPRHSNWWVNEVAVPRALARVIFLLDGEHPAQTSRRADRVLGRAWPAPLVGGSGQAANLFYRVETALLASLARRDREALASVVARAAEEIRVVMGEGLQADRSFHQHGPQFYSGSYGLEYARVAANLAVLVRGTGLELPAEKIELLTGFVVDGLGWITCGRAIDPGAQGRNFSRKHAWTDGDSVAAIARTLARLDTPRRGELESLAARIAGGVAPPGEPQGNRAFWRSDFVVHRRPGWYASVKAASSRTKGTESGNGEGLLQYHMGDGACFLFRDGTEYADIQPAWDWRLVPGTTCRQGEGRLPLVDWGYGARGGARFAGGVSDGTYGAAAMVLDRGGVRARKSWFFFDDEYVCLGSGIASGENGAVRTAVEQRRARGPVRLSGGSLETDRRILEIPAWVHQDGVGYVLLRPGSTGAGAAGASSAVVQVAEARGDWHEINRRYASEEVSASLFSIWFDHGVRPRGASYAYIVRPGIEAGELHDYAAAPPVRVLASTPDLAAVRHEGLGLVEVAFFEPGEVAAWDDLRLSADSPCLVLLRRSGEELVLSAANPAYSWPFREPFRLVLTLGEREPLVLSLEDGRTTTVSLNLSGG
ncbi:MAG: hypothetical protein HY720_11110 [Planctomycetes bacterium]|nr:hypothetical protein [Planctomycetota bacterium]